MITTGKTHDLRVARQLEFQPGTVLVIDRGYIDYQWFVELSRRKVYFVTRLKEHAVYAVVERRVVPQRSNVVADEVIFFRSHAEARKEYFFSTGGDRRSRAGALSVSDQPSQAGGRRRWRRSTRIAGTVELFFKALKQNLRIKTFVGTSSNAVRTQIWTAADLDAAAALFAVAGEVRLVVVESGGAAAPAVIRAPRCVEVAG